MPTCGFADAGGKCSGVAVNPIELVLVRAVIGHCNTVWCTQTGKQNLNAFKVTLLFMQAYRFTRPINRCQTIILFLKN